MEKKVLTVQGKRVAYIDVGEPSAPPVLLLHGFPETSLMGSTADSIRFRASHQ